ncbi:hypothetical protein [Micromonospora sp. NPDC004551]|uniref:hypothetical protein n=1 Tax=Micromonospora sp. NPDC004551 TaxID=3154284 RepID=UPI0033A89D4F
MPVFDASLRVWITPASDAPLSAYITRLKAELLRLADRGAIAAPVVTIHGDTNVFQVTLSVRADDITSAPVAAGRALRHAADLAAPSWRIDIGRIAVQSTGARPATLADLPPTP